MEEHFYIRVAETGYNMPEGFKKSDFKERGGFNDAEKQIIDGYFSNAWNNGQSGGIRETFFHLLKQESDLQKDQSLYIIKSDILFNYIDYLELQEARKNSKQAMCTAVIAIVLNLIAIGVQVYTSISTQMDKGQFDEIKELIQNIK